GGGGKEMTALTLTKDLAENFLVNFPAEATHEIERRPSREVLALLKAQDTETGAKIISHLSLLQAADLLEKLGADRVVPNLEKMERRDAAQAVSQWSSATQEKLLKKLSPAVREEIQGLLQYNPDQAGYFMDPKVLSFAPDASVKEVLARMRAQKKTRFLNILVVDESKKLLGLVPLAELLLATGSTPIADLMNPNPYVVSDLAPREETIDIFDKSRLISLPVVNFEGRLLGVIRQSALVQAVEQEALSDLQTMVGAGSEERALSRVSFAVKKRLPWLHINLATAFLAAAVVGIFESTIAKFTALAVLLPVVAGQSGNSGAQALAVTLRGLALREVRVRQWARIAFKETRVGLINGVAVAITTGVGVYVWSRSFGLSLVIGLAMVISMMAAGLAGAVIPLTLTALKQDPAQSSSIFLTTVTDIVGFLSFLGLATILASFI
ncbi:MAG: magnesium transporter, partial [bacterium]|nr:magnesium transporter [bacterium]